MNLLLKKLSSRMSKGVQQELKRLHYARQIRSGQFVTDEPEFARLPDMIGAGDWVIDVGANIGHYTLRCSALVGATGRVLAFEPVPRTFELLAANASVINATNISLVNAAVSETSTLAGMDMPLMESSGLDNPYMAQITTGGALQVLCLSVDSFRLPKRIRLVKIDAEGHELSVLKGMREMLLRDHPTLIVEGDDTQVEAFLKSVGYSFTQIPGSWNRIFSA